MEDICVIETPSSSSSSSSASGNQSCDDRVSGKLSVAKTTSNCMATSTRPCDPRDIKRSRAYQFKSLDQNAFQLDQKITQEKPMVILDRSILTPITDGDQLNDIQMTNCNVECDVIVSEEAVIDLTIDNSIDICIPESTTDVVMEVDDLKKGENKTENGRKGDDIVIIVEDNLKDDMTKEKEKEERKEDSKMEVDTKEEKDDKMEVEVTRKEQAKAEDSMDTADKDINKSVVNNSTVSEQANPEDSMDTADKDSNKSSVVNSPTISKPEDCMDTTNIDNNKLSVANSSAVSKLPMTVSNTRVKSKPFHFNPGPIDDDLISLPSSNELSNQVLSNNFLRDIESLSDLPIGPPFSKVLNEPLMPSCSALRGSVPSNVTGTVKSASSPSTSGKQNAKNTVCMHFNLQLRWLYVCMYVCICASEIMEIEAVFQQFVFLSIRKLLPSLQERVAVHVKL